MPSMAEGNSTGENQVRRPARADRGKHGAGIKESARNLGALCLGSRPNTGSRKNEKLRTWDDSVQKARHCVKSKSGPEELLQLPTRRRAEKKGSLGDLAGFYARRKAETIARSSSRNGNRCQTRTTDAGQ
jgi:hypothetical protein